MPPIPKPKKVWIIVDMMGGAILETLEQAGVQLGQPRWQGAPNKFYNNLVPASAFPIMDKFFDEGELLYGYQD